MSLVLSDDDRAFRDEIHEFVVAKFDADMREKLRRSLTGYMDKEAHVRWQKALYEKGWVVPNWPVEYGGPGWGPKRKYLYETEMQRLGTPRVVAFGPKMVAPVIMAFGTDEQKDYFLPRIARTDDWWCQGYSEPGSGSDLASLQCMAVADGDDYIVNGSKIWTTRAQDADWIFCLVRTSKEGKRQEGISFLLIDMKSPGITVEPIVLMDGADAPQQEVNQVFFDDVRVPQKNRIGEENKGWTYAKYLLEFERGNAYAGALRGGLEKVKKIAAQERADGERLADDPDFASRLAALEVEISAVEMTELRIISKLENGARMGPESSLLKCRGTDVGQSVAELAMDAVSYYAAPHDLDAHAFGGNIPPVGPDYSLGLTARYLNGRKTSIYGGSNEIQRNIMAKLILNM